MHPISQPPDRLGTLHHAGQITPSEVIHNQEDLKYDNKVSLVRVQTEFKDR